MNIEEMIAAIKSGLLRALPVRALADETPDDPERYRLWVTSDGVTNDQANAIRAFLNGPREPNATLAQMVVANDVRLCPTALVDEHRASYVYDRVLACFRCEACKALQAAALAQATEEIARQ